MSEFKPLVQKVEDLLPSAFSDGPKLQYHELFKHLGQNFKDEYSFDEVQGAVAELIGKGILIRSEADILEYYNSD